MVVIS
jgi:hypothetical protein